MTAEELLENRIRDLADRADSWQVCTHTHFLSPLEQSIFLHVKKEGLPVAALLYGKNEAAIRKIAVFGQKDTLEAIARQADNGSHAARGNSLPKNSNYEENAWEQPAQEEPARGESIPVDPIWDDPIRILHICPKAEKFAEELSHRDYLGAIMSLGLEREMTGDIIVRGKEAWVYVLDSALDYLQDSLQQIRHTQVICKEVTGDIPALRPVFQTLHCNVASERIDLLLGAAAGLNREKAKKLLAEEKVFINGRPVLQAGQKLKAGDELVIRGFGKYIYEGIQSVTKKDRLQVSLKKYM